MKDLTFRALREGNIDRREVVLRERMPNFNPETDTWTLNDWMTALVGEVGEAANILKKVKRGDFTLDFIREDLAEELADAQSYLDLLSTAAGISLEAATRNKWNKVAEKYHFQRRLEDYNNE